jgi:hypothetical protein
MIGSKPRYATTESILIADQRSARTHWALRLKAVKPLQVASKTSASETYPVAVFLDIAEKLLGNWKTSLHV